MLPMIYAYKTTILLLIIQVVIHVQLSVSYDLQRIYTRNIVSTFYNKIMSNTDPSFSSRVWKSTGEKKEAVFVCALRGREHTPQLHTKKMRRKSRFFFVLLRPLKRVGAIKATPFSFLFSLLSHHSSSTGQVEE